MCFVLLFLDVIIQERNSEAEMSLTAMRRDEKRNLSNKNNPATTSIIYVAH